MGGNRTPQPDFFIDPSIQGIERYIIEKLMNTLDPEDRENVIYVTANGNVYANKPNLKKEMVPFEYLAGNNYRDPTTGKVIPIAKDTRPKQDIRLTLSCSGDTGPFRGVYSYKQFSRVTSYAYLPGGLEIQDKDYLPSDDTGYVYVGGWGNSPETAVDAGMQHSPTNHWWTPFINSGGVYFFGATPYLHYL